jgi:hypothetical protein
MQPFSSIPTPSTILDVWQTTEKFFKLSPGEAKGKKIDEIVPLSELPEVISKGLPHIGISKTRGRNTVISRFPLFKDGKVIGDCMRRHRHQEFIRFLKKIDSETPAGLGLNKRFLPAPSMQWQRSPSYTSKERSLRQHLPFFPRKQATARPAVCSSEINQDFHLPSRPPGGIQPVASVGAVSSSFHALVI